MAYRFKSHEHPGKGLRRIYCEELACACRQCEGGPRGVTARHVHEVRKHLKKSRAVLRLLCDEIGPKRFKRENRRLRDAGRRLSALRDAEVRLKTLEKLDNHFMEARGEFCHVWRRLSHERRAHAEQAEAALQRVAEELRKAARKARQFKVSGLGPKEFCDSVRRTRRRARAALAEARDTGDHDAIHELRKRLKDLWYQLRIVCPVNPAVLREQVRQADELTELLGEYLDLSVLQEALGAGDWEPDAATEREAIAALIEKRQPELLEAALQRAGAFLCEQPGAFAKRLLGYFC